MFAVISPVKNCLIECMTTAASHQPKEERKEKENERRGASLTLSIFTFRTSAYFVTRLSILLLYFRHFL